MTNLEKAKLLKELRLKMNFTQEQMADALGLDSTYISQLENARRPIDDWYVDKAQEFFERFEKSNLGKLLHEAHAARETAPVSEVEVWKKRAQIAETKLARLRDGMRSLLDLSADVPVEHSEKLGGVSSSQVAATALASRDAAAEVARQHPESSQKRGAGEPSARKPSRADDAERKS